MIRTPDQRLRVFVSSTLAELAAEREAVRRAIERLHLSPVMFEMGARPHPPRELYRAYLQQSDVFVGIYWQRYGWVAPGESVSGLEDEYRLANGLPQLLYIKDPAPDREPALSALLKRVQENDQTSYRRFGTVNALEELVAQDLALLLSERFQPTGGRERLGPVSRVPAQVPAPLTRTIGRDGDVGQVLGLLDNGRRLVTVTGPGGVGKTRLAVEVARVLSERPGSAVHFVALATVTSPPLVLRTITEQLGLQEGSEGSPFDLLLEYFADRSALLVLDNLEQVVAVGPELARLLERAPGLRLLTTSRQALRVMGELEFQLGPLGLPASDAGVDDVRGAPSVELLLERAHERGVGIEVTTENSADFAELCTRLAGLPLAIELAVPRLRLLSPRALLERLGSTLDLPPAGEDLPSRQRTLRSALAWSHELLDADERQLLARMSVFRGGATLDAAQSVCLEPGKPVDTALAGLLDKSLLHVAEPLPGGEPRIQMLEPVRDFAREQLEEQGEAAYWKLRHLEYFAALSRKAQPYLCGAHQRDWAAVFDAERPNVREAIQTALETGAYGAALRVMWDTFVYFYIRDALAEPTAWILQIAPVRGELSRTDQALLDLGLMVVGESPAEPSPEVLLEEADKVLCRADLLLEAAVSRHHLGLHRWRSGRWDDSLEALADASRRYAAIDHDWGVALVELTMGAAYSSRGRADVAKAHFAKSLEFSRRIDNRHQMAQGLQGLALVEAMAGHPDDALERLRDAADLVLEDRSVAGATYCLEALGAAVLAKGGHEEAVRLIAAARAVRSRWSIPDWSAAGDATEPVIAAARRGLPAATFAEQWRAGADPAVDVLELLRVRLGDLLGGAVRDPVSLTGS